MDKKMRTAEPAAPRTMYSNGQHRAIARHEAERGSAGRNGLDEARAGEPTALVEPPPDWTRPPALPQFGTAEPGTWLLVLAATATERGVERLLQALHKRGLLGTAHELGSGVVQVAHATEAELAFVLDAPSMVAHMVNPDSRYRLVRRDVVPDGSVVRIGNVPFGGVGFGVIAGPCAVESREQLLGTARAVAAAGAMVLRGGVFKPRTSPYLFQGIGLAGLELLAEARAVTGLPFVTEILDPSQIEPMYPHVDAFQVGARNMQNYALLKALSDVDKPVLLKRNPGVTVEEWLLAAEYLLAGGNAQVILCERGIRTFNTGMRFTLDLASVALAKRATHLPVIVDPSHATGDPRLVAPMARAALAAGADGVMLEVHTDPAEAMSDGFQAILPDQLAELVDELAAIAPLVGRVVGSRWTGDARSSVPGTAAIADVREG